MAQDYVGTLNLLLSYAKTYNTLSTHDKESYQIMRYDLIKVLQRAAVSQFNTPSKKRRWLPYAEYKAQKQKEYQEWSRHRDPWD